MRRVGRILAFRKLKIYKRSQPARSTRAIQFSLRTRPPPSWLWSDADGARIEQMFGSRVMRKVSVFVIAIFLACRTFAANESREQKRLAACGQVFKEILDIP